MARTLLVVLGRVLDDSYPAEVRQNITALTIGRLCANSCYRFAPPFLAVIARGLHVSLAELGVAIAISEGAGLSSPWLGHVVDRVDRRLSATLGLVGVGAGALVAAGSTGRLQFALALILLAQSKVVFDLSLGAWIADHVPYDRRGRVVGLTETSWALGLLIGVSLMGLLTAATSWRYGYTGGAVAVLVMSVVIGMRLRHDHVPPAPVTPAPDTPASVGAPAHITGRLWRVMLGGFALMAAAQCVFVTFGSWLKDTFGFSAAQLSAVAFVLGGVELVASVTAARRTDQWGKERSTAAGAMLMIPSMLLLAMWHEHFGLGLALLAAAIVGFEFAIVSALSLGAQLIPASPARGLGMMIGAGTAGRAVMSISATRLYTAHGLTAPMVLGASAATVAVAAFWPRPSHTLTT